jgi:Tfp pilus assembly major pilin PilA
MKAGRRPVHAAVWVTLAVLAAVAGCSGDIAGELSRNVTVRERVMTAIAADSSLSGEMAQRMLATDAQRRRMIEAVLGDDRSARYIIGRIGRSPDAVDMVLQVASADSTGRAHLMTLFKGMQIAMKGAKK